MFLVEDKDGHEYDRWTTLESAQANAKQVLRENPKLKQVVIWEGNQQTGKRTRVQTVRRA